MNNDQVKPMYFFYSDWKSVKSLDFTLIRVSFEANPEFLLDVHIAFLGFHFWFQLMKRNYGTR